MQLGSDGPYSRFKGLPFIWVQRRDIHPSLSLGPFEILHKMQVGHLFCARNQSNDRLSKSGRRGLKHRIEACVPFDLRVRRMQPGHSKNGPLCDGKRLPINLKLGVRSSLNAAPEHHLSRCELSSKLFNESLHAGFRTNNLP